ncbi:AAA family ATPase [Sphingomonas alba]|uniref:AAA family ATPase n=1 Tax=Sphingomonas alba TaxID=2908208 RepID=A0ABT0RP76_9SPHN|nr:AAA family ATPase [Sphingomonas alba]MCL6684454.1 AAA family ATPase [Sphingomonas alba]
MNNDRIGSLRADVDFREDVLALRERALSEASANTKEASDRIAELKASQPERVEKAREAFAAAKEAKRLSDEARAAARREVDAAQRRVQVLQRAHAYIGPHDPKEIAKGAVDALRESEALTEGDNLPERLGVAAELTDGDFRETVTELIEEASRSAAIARERLAGLPSAAAVVTSWGLSHRSPADIDTARLDQAVADAERALEHAEREPDTSHLKLCRDAETSAAEAVAAAKSEIAAAREALAVGESELEEEARQRARIREAAGIGAVEAGEYRAYSVNVDFHLSLNGIGIEEVRALHSSEDCDFCELSFEQVQLVHKELRSRMSRWHEALRRMGCVAGGLIEAPYTGVTDTGYFLLVRGDADLPIYSPHWDADGEQLPCLGMLSQIPVEGVPGAELSLVAWAHPSSIEEAYDALINLSHSHPVDEWGAKRTPGRLPKADEQVSDWLARVALSQKATKFYGRRLRTFGLNLLAAVNYPHPDAPARPKALIDGLLFSGYVAVLGGAGGAGKSTFLHNMLAVLNAPIDAPNQFLGRDVTRQFPVAFFASEGTEEEFAYRSDHYERRWGDSSLLYQRVNADELSARLDELRDLILRSEMEVGALVVDSFRGTTSASENSSEEVRGYYQRLIDFAEETDWAVVVSHHLTKGDPKSFADLKSKMRGSGEHLNSVRLAFGLMSRKNGQREFGVLKSNVPREFMWLGEGESVTLHSDAETHSFELVEANPQKEAQAATVSDAELQRVLSAVAACNASGVAVRRSGSSGIFELRLPELEGMSRSVARSAFDTLVASDRLRAGANGMTAMEAG